MAVGVIAVIVVGVAVAVAMGRAVSVVVVHRVFMRDVGVGRRVRVGVVGVRCRSVRMVRVRSVGVRWRVRMRCVVVVVVVLVWRRAGYRGGGHHECDVVPVRRIAVHVVVRRGRLRGGRGDVDGRHHRHHPARPQQRPTREVLLALARSSAVFLLALRLVVRSRVVAMGRHFPPRRSSVRDACESCRADSCDCDTSPAGRSASPASPRSVSAIRRSRRPADARSVRAATP